MKHTSILLIFIILSCTISSQNKASNWDDTQKQSWGFEFEEVKIISTLDGNEQAAMFYKAKSKTPRPLIVSLHTWSGNYKQEDPISRLMIEYDYNYIHPDFRGANDNPLACGSEYVVSDLEDAIEYALKNTNVDPKEVHIVGTSGGGYATLVAYMNIKYPVKSFSAWVPLSNLENWYWESVGRKQHYKDHILKATESKSELNITEARKRSPYFQEYPANLRKDAKLYIYAGIHDGYKGSVPITQSLDMYNKIAQEAFGASDDELISNHDKLELVAKRCFPFQNFNMNIGDRKIHYFKKKENVSVSIFEGGHEQIIDQVIPLIPIDKKYELIPKVVLNIGDSNSSFEYSWPQLLSKKRIGNRIINYSIPGNTIGFDNLEKKQLNTLANIDSVLVRLANEHQSIDYVIISLGTNDCKKIFEGREKESMKNVDELIKRIKSYEFTKKSKILLLAIPPVDKVKLSDKYEGIESRILTLNNYYKTKANNSKNVSFIDTYSILKPNVNKYTDDGIHLNEEAQRIVAEKIVKIVAK